MKAIRLVRKRPTLLPHLLGIHRHGLSSAACVVVAQEDAAPSSRPIAVSSARPRLEALRAQLQKEEPDKRPRWQQSSSSYRIEPTPTTIDITHATTPTTAPPVLIKHSPTTYQDWQKVLATLPDPPSSAQVLQDSFGRHHNYLRLSLTERCNFRCTYCMPLDGVPLQPNDKLLTTNEILTLAEHFAAVGVDKFRLTGGEPTLRKDIVDVVTGLKQIHPNAGVGITTNGFLLGQKPALLRDLVDAGLSSINVSLDSLDAGKFEQITRRPASYLPKVLHVLDQTQAYGKDVSVKVNIVVMRGQNDDELADFVRLGHAKNVVIRFIEYMPFTKNGWNTDTFMSYREIMEQTQSHVTWEALAEADPHDTTKWYRAVSRDTGGDDQSTTVGFITSMSHHFCAGCNRLRISADGQIKVCLFDNGSHMVSLRNALRAGLSRDELYKIVHAAVQSKPQALGGHVDAVDIQNDSMNNRPMTLIGG